MIDSILAIVLGNSIEAAVIAIVGLFLGVFFSLIYWTGQVNKRKKHIKNLDGNIEELESNIKDLETTVEGKNTDLETMRTRAQELITAKENEIEGLKNQVKNYEAVLEERNNEMENLNNQLSQREYKILDLNRQIDEKNTSIDLLNKESADLDKKNQASVERAEAAETRVVELENSLEEKKREAASLKARIRAMQDDFTYIDGIGPKVSTVLRLAGIKTFAKLASTEVDKIRDILEKENPSLLRLTDPSTWSEQARLASEEDWEALSELQDSLKESRRS